MEDMTGVTEDSATFRSIPEEPVTYGQFQQVSTFAVALSIKEMFSQPDAVLR